MVRDSAAASGDPRRAELSSLFIEFGRLSATLADQNGLLDLTAYGLISVDDDMVQQMVQTLRSLKAVVELAKLHEAERTEQERQRRIQSLKPASGVRITEAGEITWSRFDA